MERRQREQSWAVTRGHLDNARHLLPERLRDSDEGWSLERYEEWLAHNELELALEELEGLGDENDAPTAFWAELLAAAENMGLAQHVERCKQRLAGLDLNQAYALR